MKIIKPEILKYESKVAFDNFADFYNAQKNENSSKLKSTHIQLYKKLVDDAVLTLRVKQSLSKKSEFSIDDNFCVKTKISTLKYALRCSENTVKARLRRLEQAETIRLEYHPDTQEYAVYFSSLLLVKGENQPQIKENCPFLKSLRIKPLKYEGYQNLTPCLINVTFTKLIKSSIIVKGVQNSEKTFEQELTPVAEILNDQKKASPDKKVNTTSNIQGSKIEPTDLQAVEKLQETKKQILRINYTNGNAEITQLQQTKINISLRILTLAIQLLWKGRDVLEQEFETALFYISNNYLITGDLQALHDFEKDAYRRIEMAARYCERKNYKISVFPVKYFDKEFEKGFKNTLEWLKNEQNRKFKKKQEAQAYDERKKIIEIYETYRKTETLTTFTATANYVQSTYPQMVDTFSMLVSSNPTPQQLSNFYTTNQI